MTSNVASTFRFRLNSAILCLPGLSLIERCGVISIVATPSIAISHGGFVDTIRIPLPAGTAVSAATRGRDAMGAAGARAPTSTGAERGAGAGFAAGAGFDAGAGFAAG